MGRRYRKKRSAAGSIISDTAYIGSRLPWWGALLVGSMLFLIFYLFLPAWLTSQLAENQSNMFYPALEMIFGRRIHWLKWLGSACGLIGVYFAVRNYFSQDFASTEERGIVGFLARVFGRSID